MVRNRVIVGSTYQDDQARLSARRLLEQGHEVVFVGGGQSAEQLLRTAEAEDAPFIVVDGDDQTIALLRELSAQVGPEAPRILTLVQGADLGGWV